MHLLDFDSDTLISVLLSSSLPKKRVHVCVIQRFFFEAPSNKPRIKSSKNLEHAETLFRVNMLFAAPVKR